MMMLRACAATSRTRRPIACARPSRAPCTYQVCRPWPPGALLEHAHHRRQPHAAAQQHDGPVALLLEEELAGGRRDAEPGARCGVVVEPVRGDPRRDAAPGFALDRNAVGAVVGTGGVE